MNVKYIVLILFVTTSCSPCPTSTISLHQWSRQEQRQAAEEIKALPDDSILVGMFLDYARLRREAN